MLLAELLGARRDLSCQEDPPRGLDLDVVDRLGDPLPVLFATQVAPAGERLEIYGAFNRSRNTLNLPWDGKSRTRSVPQPTDRGPQVHNSDERPAAIRARKSKHSSQGRDRASIAPLGSDPF